MDQIEITSIKTSATIGVHAWEQKIKQSLLIDVSIPIDLQGIPDELSHTIDYDQLSQSVIEFVSSKSFQLVETLANELSEHIKKLFELKKLNLSVSKPHAVKQAKNVKVTVCR